MQAPEHGKKTYNNQATILIDSNQGPEYLAYSVKRKIIKQIVGKLSHFSLTRDVVFITFGNIIAISSLVAGGN